MWNNIILTSDPPHLKRCRTAETLIFTVDASILHDRMPYTPTMRHVNFCMHSTVDRVHPASVLW
ncbi:MAG: hypothetical protein AAF570_00355 [Bacteroidota bacterium]